MDNDSVIGGDDDDDELHWSPPYQAKSHCVTDNDIYIKKRDW